MYANKGKDVPYMLQHFEFLWESLLFFVTEDGGWKNLVMLAVGVVLSGMLAQPLLEVLATAAAAIL